MTDRESIDNLARNIEQHAFRRGYVSAFTLAAYPVKQDEDLTLHITRECDGLVYGNAEVGSVDAFKACLKALDGRFDYIFYDTNLNFDLSGFMKEGEFSPKKSILLAYSDLYVWVESVRYTLLTLVPYLASKNLMVVGHEIEKDNLGGFLLTLVQNLKGCCRNAWSYQVDKPVTGVEQGKSDRYFKAADILVGAAVYQQVLDKPVLELCESAQLIVDAGIGTISVDAAEYAREKGLRLIRVDNRAAMAGTLLSLIQSHDLVTRVMGKGEIDGVPVVAGGEIGTPGTIVVDSIDQPSMVIGFADGTGRIRYKPENEEEGARLGRVKKAIKDDTGNG